MNTYETGEIFAQLANLLPLDKSVDWSHGFGLVDRIVEAERHVKASDFTIPIFVYSVANSPTPGLKEELADIFHTAKKLTNKTQKRKRETHEAVIQFLYEVIRDGKFRADYPRDADQEMIDRKLFVLNYIHQREMKLHEANLARQKDVENVRMEQAFRLRQQEEEARIQKNRVAHKERMERLQRHFERQKLRDQFEHQERLENMKKKGNKKT
ncbi:unnamed protein product [Ranitomeya imitator]|uniref:Uncharacterized protein n=1 Tax=Ranitomeya imitator TaxID=111125 RepID=A0ABN9LS98_9NEOB|nr:unnamed protein product [Ranitomeya imitator]